MSEDKIIKNGICTTRAAAYADLLLACPSFRRDEFLKYLRSTTLLNEARAALVALENEYAEKNNQLKNPVDTIFTHMNPEEGISAKLGLVRNKYENLLAKLKAANGEMDELTQSLWDLDNPPIPDTPLPEMPSMKQEMMETLAKMSARVVPLPSSPEPVPEPESDHTETI